jgi:hypothetical protein
MNRYVYALDNPLSNIDPSGLECVWDDGSYDGEYDPTTGEGNPGGCAQAGGTWVELGMDGGWTDQSQSSTGLLTITIDVIGFTTWGTGGLSTEPGSGPGGNGPNAPNNGNQSSWQQKMRQASHYICGTSPADRVVKSVLTGAGIGAITGGFGGFVAGEVFGGEVTFGLTGIPGAYIGAHIGAAVGAVNGLGQGAVLAGICYAGFQYDN